jgi:hypothetical protein
MLAYPRAAAEMQQRRGSCHFIVTISSSNTRMQREREDNVTNE